MEDTKSPTAAASYRPMLRRMNLVLGIVLLVAGVLLDTVGLTGPGEVVVAAAGPFVIVAGLIWIILVLVKDMPARANYLGLIAIVLGAILLTHDAVFQPPLNTIIHIGTGIALVLVGVLHIVGRTSLLALLGRRGAKST